jgi:integrase
MSMEGRIYARGNCPLCAGRFQVIEDDLICPIHLIRPKRTYIQIRHKDIYSDPKGHPFSSYEQAKRYLDRMRTEIDEKTFDLSRYVAQRLKPLRFSNWSEAWLKKKRTEVDRGLRAPSYLKVLKVYVQKYNAFFGETDIREIGTKQIHEFYLSLSGAPHYIRNILGALEKIFHDALDWGDIGLMPKFQNVEIPESEIKTIDLDDQDRIIDAISDPMDRAFILFTAREMVRPSETRALQWEDVDLKHDRITIRRHFSLSLIRPATKAKQIKILPLDGEVKKGLQALPRHISSPFVFWKGNKGKNFSESWARKLWRRTSLSLGMDISLYQGTRHSSATEAVNRVGVDATQEFLHHTNRAMTKRYAKVNPEGLKKVLRQGK